MSCCILSKIILTPLSTQQNVLVNREGRGVLCDFGISATAQLDSQIDTQNHKTNCRWLAFELCINDECKITTKTDVYSFGMFCLEVSNKIIVIITSLKSL